MRPDRDYWARGASKKYEISILYNIEIIESLHIIIQKYLKTIVRNIYGNHNSNNEAMLPVFWKNQTRSCGTDQAYEFQ